MVNNEACLMGSLIVVIPIGQKLNAPISAQVPQNGFVILGDVRIVAVM